ncbi:10489_t:CDS:1 [Paraglomus occultum]|uniref:10489_t:CDS:1 n=1 Tax=Paraglomus occultum TaxID=144539 RepID=A0A9N9D6G6_9GLOM|nr:10489_t:CDS:1 [Paraglomus occultum]
MLSVTDFLEQLTTASDKRRMNNPPTPLHLPVHELIAPSKRATRLLPIYEIWRRNYVASHKNGKPNYRRLSSLASRIWLDEGPAVRAYFVFLQQLMRRYLDIAHNRSG